MPRQRRKSSGLTGEPRGDTGAPAVSTLEPLSTIASPPSSPRPSSGTIPRTSKRRKVRSYLRRWKSYSFKHTWLNPLLVTVLILLLYAINPRESNPLHRAIFPSYPLPKDHPLIPDFARNDPDAPLYYGKGPADISFVCFYTVVLSFTREFIMQRLLRPAAVWFGIRSRTKQARFMEQGYTVIYFSIWGPLGLYVMSRTPVWFFNTDGMYEGFPHRSHEGIFKAYYLLQASYWAQQAIVLILGLEKPRKDYLELVAHHIVTLALIGLSYRFHFTYMGLAVYVTHDISDFFLASSKTFNYIEASITGPYFVFFVAVWTYLRHYINLKILYSILTTFATIGPFEIDWEAQQYKCRLSQVITFSLLAFLQAINIFWLVLIIRIALRVVFKDQIKDDRSDDESTDEEEGDKGKDTKTAKPASMVNGKPKGDLKVGISSAIENAALNGSAVESDPNTPNTPQSNGMPGLKKR